MHNRNQTLELQLTSEEDNIKFDEDYPERRRGSIPELLKLIYEDPTLDHYDTIQFKVHRSFCTNSGWYNPATICQQVRRTNPARWQYYHAYRETDYVILVASNHEINIPKTFTSKLVATLQNLKATDPKKLLSKHGQDASPHLDLAYDDLPESYRQYPHQLRHRLAMRKDPVHIKTKLFREFLRIWLLKLPWKTLEEEA